MKKHSCDRMVKKSGLSGDDGTTALEFGLLVPLLVTLLLGCAEIGFFIQQVMVVNSAVEAGVTLAARRGFDPKGITNAVLQNTVTPGLQATPAPSLFCGCAARNGIDPAPCDVKCADGLVPGHYVKIGAFLTPQTILPSRILPLPATITAQSIIRLN